MTKQIPILFLIVGLSSCGHTPESSQQSTPSSAQPQTGESKMSNPWFKNSKFKQLEILVYKQGADREPSWSYIIKSERFIDLLQKRISQIPSPGDENISFAGGVQVTVLNFSSNEGSKETIEIYNGNVKTPATSFNSQHGLDEDFVKAVSEGLRFPDFGKNIPAIEDIEIRFPEFIVVYHGEKESSPAPVTASFTRHTYQIKSLNGKDSLTVTIIAGQVPPQPVDFKIGSKKFSLITFENEPGKLMLYPNFFRIEKTK